jgi:signal transduction histidine kinase/DNA-binding response OmpR family regulator
MTRYVLNVCFFLFFSLFAWGQRTDYQVNISTFTEKDGLSNNDVFCVNEDTRGILWVGTRYGLNRFDGKGFRTFTVEDGLKNNFVSAVFPISGEYLLLGLGEPQSELILAEDFQFFDAINPTTVANFEAVLPLAPFKKAAINYILPQENGFLFVLKNQQNFFFSQKKEWIKVDFIQKNEKILVYFPKKYTWTTQLQNDTLTLQKRSYDGKLLFSIKVGTETTSNLTWLRADAKGDAYFKYIDLKSGLPVHILKITKSGVRQTIHTFEQKPDKDYFLPDCIIYSPTLNANVGSNSDRTVLFSNDWQPLWEVPSSIHGIITQYRQSYFSTNTIWQCSCKGLHRITFEKKRFVSLFNEEENITFRNILRIGDRLLFNSEKGLWEKKGNQITQIYPIFLLASAQVGDDFFTSSFHGIYRFDRNNKLKNIYETKENEIWGMWGDAFGGLWWSGRGLKRLDLETEVSTSIDYKAFEALASATVYYFYPLSKNRVWLCTTEGLFEFDPQRQKIKARYWTGGKGKYYLPTNDLRHLYHDKKTGEFWFATGQTGLLRWQPEGGKTQIFPFLNNATNITHGVYADEFGFLWLPTDNGIVQFHRSTERFRIYRHEYGLKDSEFNRISHFQDTDGSFYFGGMEGVTYFHPRDFKEALENTNKTQLFVVEALQYEGEKDTVADKTTDFLAQNRLIIRPQDRFFAFTFGLTDYTLAQDAVYFYQLKGDETWQTSEKSQLTFWRLPYGKQTIFVKARLINGSFTETLPISVWIKRPFYLQWWFVLFVILLVGIGVLSRVKRLQKQNQTLEAEVTRRTQRIEAAKTIIEKQAAELQKSDEIKSRFFANISHELRTPLTLITSPLRKLESQELNPEKQQLLHFAVKNSQRLLRLVNEILDLTKLEATEMVVMPQSVSIIFFARRVLAEFESFAAHKGVALSLETDFSEAATAFFDLKKVETILYNLLSNALKFTPQGGKVVLTIKEKDREKNREKNTEKNTEKTKGVAFEVADTGRGIPSEELAYIFDRFYQSQKQKNAEGGTGIGLAICREFTTLMKGSLTVESEVAKGTRFEFFMPSEVFITENNHDKTTENPVFETMPTFLAKETATDEYLPHLLLVEDNEDLQRYIKFILEKNYRITTANNGKLAVDFLNTCEAENLPSLILSDIMMPEMDGFQLLAYLKNTPEFRQIPVIILTARAGTDDRLRALRIGVDDYLTKPFLETELCARIENLLKNAEVRHENQLNHTEIISEIPESWLQVLEKIIRNNLQEPTFSVDFLAEEFGYTRQTLNKNLKAAIGLTTTEYIKEVRLNLARELLVENANLTVKEVAEVIGVSNVKYFSRQFKERFGISPSDV